MRSSSNAPTPHIELVPMRELLRVLGVKSRQTVYDRLRSDPTFPRPRRTGQHSMAWLRAEVESWVIGLPIAQLDGLNAIERRQFQAGGAT